MSVEERVKGDVCIMAWMALGVTSLEACCGESFKVYILQSHQILKLHAFQPSHPTRIIACHSVLCISIHFNYYTHHRLNSHSFYIPGS